MQVALFFAHDLEIGSDLKQTEEITEVKDKDQG